MNNKVLIVFLVLAALGTAIYFTRENTNSGQSLSEKTTIEAYFNNSKLDPEFSCNKVFPVEREIVKTSAVARAALEEL